MPDSQQPCHIYRKKEYASIGLKIGGVKDVWRREVITVLADAFIK